MMAAADICLFDAKDCCLYCLRLVSSSALELTAEVAEECRTGLPQPGDIAAQAKMGAYKNLKFGCVSTYVNALELVSIKRITIKT